MFDEHEDNMHVERILIYYDVTSYSAESFCNDISIMIKRIATIHHEEMQYIIIHNMSVHFLVLLCYLAKVFLDLS